MAPGSECAPVASNAFDGTWASGCELEDEESPEDGYDIVMLEVSGVAASCQIPDAFIVDGIGESA